MTLLRLLALAAMLTLARVSHDPFRPASRPFPRTRLTRAGLDAEVVDRLETEYDALDYRQQVEFGRFVSSHSDDAIRDRFSEGVQGVQPPADPPAEPVTYELLNGETVDELEERIRTWNASHDEAQHLTLSGRKAELIGRLLDAYEQPEEAPVVSEPVQVAVAGTEQPTGGTTAAEQVVPTAPTATTPEGAPEASSAASAAPAGTTEAGTAPTGAQAPAQTADAAPGAGVAPSTTTED